MSFIAKNVFENVPNQKEREEDLWKYTFPAEKSDLSYAFYRTPDSTSSEKVAYATIHFDGKVFRHPDNKQEILVADFIASLKERLGVEKVVLSCCYPDKARELIGEVPGLKILGSGNCEVRTKYNDREGIITVEPTTTK